MKIFIDSEYKCHTTNPAGTYTEVKTGFFDRKCGAFIEGFRYVPEGKIWVDSDGVEFSGLMISPWKNYSELDAVQREFERDMLAQKEATIEELDTLVLNLQYDNLINN